MAIKRLQFLFMRSVSKLLAEKVHSIVIFRRYCVVLLTFVYRVKYRVFFSLFDRQRGKACFDKILLKMTRKSVEKKKLFR